MDPPNEENPDRQGQGHEGRDDDNDEILPDLEESESDDGDLEVESDDESDGGEDFMAVYGARRIVEDGDDEEEEEEADMEQEGNEAAAPAEAFDTQLPTQHRVSSGAT